MGSTPVQHSVSNVKAVVAAFNQEKALVGAFSRFSVITNLRMELFEALVMTFAVNETDELRVCVGPRTAAPAAEKTARKVIVCWLLPSPHRN